MTSPMGAPWLIGVWSGDIGEATTTIAGRRRRRRSQGGPRRMTALGAAAIEARIAHHRHARSLLAPSRRLDHLARASSLSKAPADDAGRR
jgi:hypothetical protein